jgi:hypothetical protein
VALKLAQMAGGESADWPQFSVWFLAEMG